MVDIHIHSEFSHDSRELRENYLKRAAEFGENVIGFSEHYDYDAVLDGDNLPLADCAASKSSIETLQDKYPSVKILYGIELGYSKAAEEEYSKLLKNYPFDYAIISVHSLAGYGDFYHGRAFKSRGVKQAYLDYLAAVLESVTSGLDFQVVGHIGYCARYCPERESKVEYGVFPEIIDEILTQIIKRGKCLEINTSTGGKGGFLPDKSIIERYIELGGKAFSFASDAHTADKYLRGSAEVADFLKSKGITYMRYYECRQPKEYKI